MEEQAHVNQQQEATICELKSALRQQQKQWVGEDRKGLCLTFEWEIETLRLRQVR